MSVSPNPTPQSSGMSVFKAMAWAKDQRTGSVGRKTVLMALAERCGEEARCFPSQALIAEETEQAVRTVQRCLEELERMGFISKERRYVDFEGRRLGRGKACNTYTLLIDQHDNLSSGPTDQHDKRPTTNTTNGHDQHDTAMAQEVPSLELPYLEQPRAADAAHREVARALVKRVWERSSPRPATPFVAALKIAEKLIEAGHAPEEVEESMMSAPTISVRCCEIVLNDGRRRKPSKSDRNRQVMTAYLNGEYPTREERHAAAAAIPDTLTTTGRQTYRLNGEN